jgi:hypothetical protein
MRRTIYSCTKALEPKDAALELPHDDTSTDPSPNTGGGGIGGASLHAHGREAGVAFSGSTDMHFD